MDIELTDQSDLTVEQPAAGRRLLAAGRARDPQQDKRAGEPSQASFN